MPHALCNPKRSVVKIIAPPVEKYADRGVNASS